MNPLLDKAVQAMNEFVDMTERMKQGEVVSPLELSNNARDLVAIHWEISRGVAVEFSAKEKAYIHRKIANAKAYKRNRYEKEMKSAKDAEMESLADIEKEMIEECDKMSSYEYIRQIQRSLERAIDMSRSTTSLIKQHEQL